METHNVVEIRPDILGGIPVFRGTRVPIHNLIDSLATASSSFAKASRVAKAMQDKMQGKWREERT